MRTYLEDSVYTSAYNLAEGEFVLAIDDAEPIPAPVLADFIKDIDALLRQRGLLRDDDVIEIVALEPGSKNVKIKAHSNRPDFDWRGFSANAALSIALWWNPPHSADPPPPPPVICRYAEDIRAHTSETMVCVYTTAAHQYRDRVAPMLSGVFTGTDRPDLLLFTADDGSAFIASALDPGDPPPLGEAVVVTLDPPEAGNIFLIAGWDWPD